MIISVGQQMGIGPYGIKIALATALQESGLRNLDYGDRDSLGLFQQRPSQGWGTPQQVRDPAYAAKKFYSGLQGVKGWENMPLSRAAQAVQRSAYPDAYAKWEDEASALLNGTPLPRATTAPTGIGNARAPESSLSAAQPQGVVPLAPDLSGAQEDAQGLVEAMSVQDDPKAAAPGAGAATAPGIEAGDKQPNYGGLSQTNPLDMGNLFSGGVPVQYGAGAGGSRKASMLAREAMRYVGTPYVWGGTDLTRGVDCSGFIQALYKRFGLSLPRMSMDQARSGSRVKLDQLQTGDLVAWDNSTRNNGADHVAFYLGNGQIIEAPEPGKAVRVRSLGKDEGAWGVRVLK